MMRLSIGYPDKEQEIRMASQFLQGKTPDTVTGVCSAKDIVEARSQVGRISITDEMLQYMQTIIEATRSEERFKLGASPRAYLSLIRASQAAAYLEERDYVKPDDVKYVADSVLAHRLSLSPEAQIRKENVSSILKSLILKVKVPV